jgi:L-ascorbate metabolism protein UlaG (beta-lactamase superfamily)
MDSRNVYLRQNVAAEPLRHQWPAYSELVPPAVAAMHVANAHVRLMRSFVSAPQVHVAALRDPKMLGGPFINYDAGRGGEVKALLEDTLARQAHVLELAKALTALDKLLAAEAAGYTLEPLYEKVPEILQGLVELVYDLNNHPSIRLIEGLLYRGPLHDESLQSVALSLVAGDARTCLLSTPRLREPGALHLALPFRSPKLDALFEMRDVARPYGWIKDILGIAPADDAVFASFFTEAPPARPASVPAPPGGLRIRYFGHACVCIEGAGVTVLSDPLISYAVDSPLPRYTFADLPEKIDYVVITHNHSDHLVLETLLQIRHKVGTVVVPRASGGALADPSMKLLLESVGFPRVVALDELERIELGAGSITGAPFLGEHADLDIRSKLAYAIRLADKTVYLGADSNNLAPAMYRHLRAAIGPVDVQFVGMECDGAPLSWGHGSLLTNPMPRKMDQSRRFDGSDCGKALQMVEALEPKHVYVYAMAAEPWLGHILATNYTDESRPIVEAKKFVEACRANGRVAERLFGQRELFFK